VPKFGNTPDHNAPALCDSCVYARMARGLAESERILRCAMFEQHITIHVAECNRYEKAGELTPYDYEQTAWIISPNKSPQHGFTADIVNTEVDHRET